MTRRPVLRAVVTLATLVLAVLWWAAPAQADGEINIDDVEPSQGGDAVSVLLAVDGLPDGAEPDLDSVTVTVDGEPVVATATEFADDTSIDRITILALDASNSMRGAKFAAAKQAALAFVDAAPEDVQIGLLAFAGRPRVVSAPTSDRDSLRAAIQGLTLSNGTRLYDAVVSAVGLAGADGARSVVVLSDGQDQGRGATLEAAVAAATDASVIVDVVALNQRPDSRALLRRIASASGGTVVGSDREGLSAAFLEQADALASQLKVEFPRPEGAGAEGQLTVSIDADGSTYTDSALVPLPVEPRVVTVPTGHSRFGGSALWLGAVGLAVGLAGLLGIVLVDATRRPSLAQRQIAHYAGSPLDAFGGRALGAHGLRESAVAVTERVVTGDFETRLSQRLTGAGSSLTAAEWLLVHALVVVGSGFAGLILGGARLMVVLLLFGLALPWLWLRIRHSRRLAAFHSQLAETLQLIAGGLSAGLSMPQAIDTVVREGAEPMASELRRALVEQRLGVPIDDALEGVGQRMDSPDFGWVVMAIRIQRDVGGNLSELLHTVSDTLREREYLRRQVKVLSAEGRFSALILGALPVVMFVYLLLVRPDFVAPLLTDPTGLLLLAAGTGLLLLGIWTLSRMVRVEV